MSDVHRCSSWMRGLRLWLVSAGSVGLIACSTAERLSDQVFGRTTPQATESKARAAPAAIEVTTSDGDRIRVFDPPLEIGVRDDGRRIDAPEVFVEYQRVGTGSTERQRKQYWRLVEHTNLQQNIIDAQAGGRVNITPRVNGTMRVELQPSTIELRGGGLVSYGLAALLDDRGNVIAWTGSGNEALSRSSSYIVTRATSFVLPMSEWQRAKYVAVSGPRLDQTASLVRRYSDIWRTTDVRMAELRDAGPAMLPKLREELVAESEWWEISEIFEYTDEEAQEVLERGRREQERWRGRRGIRRD